MKISFITLCLSFVFSLNISKGYCQVAYLKDPEAAKQISKDVTTHFRDNRIQDAFNLLRQYWPMPFNEINNLESQTIQSINLISDRYGKSESIVKISEQNIKETGFRETYLVKFENTAIRLIFTYYKNNKGWVINGFKWDSDFDEEFK